MLGLPLNPKVADLVEALVGLDARLAALEGWREAHGASMSQRQAQVDFLRAGEERRRFLSSLRRR